MCLVSISVVNAHNALISSNTSRLISATWADAIAQFSIEQQAPGHVRYLASSAPLPVTGECSCLVRDCTDRGTPLCAYHHRLAAGLLRKANRAPSTYRELRETFRHEYRRGYHEVIDWLLVVGALVPGPGRRTKYVQQPRAAVTVEVQAGQLRQLARALPGSHPFTVDTATLAAYVEGRRWRAATRLGYVKTLRAFYRWAYESGRMSSNPAEQLPTKLTAPQRQIVEANWCQHEQAPNPAGVNAHRRLAAPANWHNAIESWLTELAAGQLSAGTITLRLRHLCLLAESVDVGPTAVTREHLATWLAAHDWAPATRRSARGTLVLFFRWLHDTDRIAVDPARSLPKVRVPRAVPRPAPDEAIDRGLSANDARVRLAVRIMNETGIRRGECAIVHSDHVIEGPDGALLRVTGKGGHTRHVPITDDLAALITEANGYLFESENWAGKPIEPERLGELISRALGGTWTAHTIRHRVATRAYAGTGDLLAVRDLLGHASVATTQGYTQVARDAVRQAARAASTR